MEGTGKGVGKVKGRHLGGKRKIGVEEGVRRDDGTNGIEGRNGNGRERPGDGRKRGET